MIVTRYTFSYLLTILNRSYSCVCQFDFLLYLFENVKKQGNIGYFLSNQVATSSVVFPPAIFAFVYFKDSSLLVLITWVPNIANNTKLATLLIPQIFCIVNVLDLNNHRYQNQMILPNGT